MPAAPVAAVQQLNFGFHQRPQPPYQVSIIPHKDTHCSSRPITSVNSYPPAEVIGGRLLSRRSSCRATDEHYEELLALDAEMDVFFVIGDSDPISVDIPLEPVHQCMRARIWKIKFMGADHGFGFLKDAPEKRDAICTVEGQIASIWNLDGNRGLAPTEMTLDYDKTATQAT